MTNKLKTVLQSKYYKMQNKSLLERTLAKMEKSQQKKKKIFEYMQKNKPYLL